ncbi:ABC transporter substrate-binding protein [Roseomonas eburnea]|uniref:ABC transporter substrate-binding protein n=1 Tax=Neoroseomonas eburnea TaxID=1346889 RepID=A0A9X9XA32_9PROT|nr:ABC transporter substrate-binding protein [Neoroseomonas eburnea]MBR0680568.1 ABC transporter substrate-binding protein [Neoroseomonas eburnea]
MKRSEFLAAIAATATTATLGRPRIARAQGDAAGMLRAGLKLSPTSMDPHFRLSGEQNILRALHARLVGMTADGKPEPGIAESWRPVNDGKAWEFKVRADAKFSDGSPVTAEDVAFSIARVPTIEGSAGAYHIFVRAITRVEVKDARTVLLHTASPYPFMVEDMTEVAVLSKSLGPSLRTADFNSQAVKVFSGPYTLADYRFGEFVAMRRNPHWFGQAPTFAEANFKVIASDASRMAALLAGDVQAVDEVAIQDIARLRRDANLNVTQIAGMRVMYVAMDMERDVTPFVRDAAGQPMTRNPLKDARVRLALSLALNRAAIVDRVMEGAATVASNLLPVGTPGTSAALGVTPFDPDRARRLLAEAGYPNGFQLTIHATNDRYPNDEKVAQAIAQFWTRIGVRTEVATMPNAAFFPAAARQTFSVMAAQYGADNVSYAYRALVHTYDRDRGLGTANRTRHSSPRADALVAQALTEMDEAKRNALLARAADIAIGEEAIIHMIYHPAYVYAARKPLSVTPYYNGAFLPQAVGRG